MGFWGTSTALLACVGFVWHLGTRAETGAEHGQRVTKLTLAQGVINLGQSWGYKSPLLHTKANLSDISIARSSFEFRTFDPEGLIFYGDTRDGADWFVLVLRDGSPEIQITKADIKGMVSGGRKLNDGFWHKVEVRSEGKFVVLEVDSKVELVVGLDSPTAAAHQDLAGPIRLSMGGMLKPKEELFQPLGLEMDGCIRSGNWLNLTILWQMENDSDSDPQPCSPYIKKGSFFSGKGLVVFNTSDSLFLPLPPFPSYLKEKTDGEILVEVWGKMGNWSGTLMNIQTQSHESEITITFKKETKELITKVGTHIQSTPLPPHQDYLALILSKHQIHIHFGSTEIQIPLDKPQQWRSQWNNGLILVFGGFPGVPYPSGSDYLHGCVAEIRVENQVVHLDRALFKHSSVTSYSCPDSFQNTEYGMMGGITIFGTK